MDTLKVWKMAAWKNRITLEIKRLLTKIISKKMAQDSMDEISCLSKDKSILKKNGSNSDF